MDILILEGCPTYYVPTYYLSYIMLNSAILEVQNMQTISHKLSRYTH